MVHSPHFSLSWESYNSSICKGFSALQQNGEFVDMTLAADGYYVKVHQVIMALASPFLKELISSAPCQHPVIFLNNVSHKTLSSLLEYIYTGEVLVSADNLMLFTEAARSLHIKGLEKMDGNESMSKATANQSHLDESNTNNFSDFKKKMGVSERLEQISLPVTARKILIKHESEGIATTAVTKYEQPSSMKDNSQDYVSMDDSMMHDDDDDTGPNDEMSTVLESKSAPDKLQTNLQFTVSIRGSLQIILNRYIYNLHSSKHRSNVRRWRCVDYRNHRCMAFVVTKGNIVLNRANLHNHPFHDKKILAKIEKKCVFSALEALEDYKKETDMAKEDESEEFMTLDELSEIADKSSEFIKES